MVELVEQRTARTKLFDMGGGARRFEAHIAPIHVPNDPAAWKRGEAVTWEEHDFAWDAISGGLRLRKGWFNLETSENYIGYSYTSRLTGDTLEVKLQRLDGVRVPDILPTPRVDGHNVWWDDVVPDLDIYLKASFGRVEIFKRLRGPLAPKQFQWLLIQSWPSTIPLTTATQGIDNYDWSDPAREGTGNKRRRRVIQMLAPIFGADDFTSRPGFKIFTLEEIWSGQTILPGPDPERIPGLAADVSYPVLIDQDITETIAVDNDDGYQKEATEWYTSTGGDLFIKVPPTSNYRPAMRFTDVDIPAGSTIDLATLTTRVSSRSGAPLSTLSGNAHDDAPAWGASAGPGNMTPTTANVAFNIPASGAYAVTVTSIVQEIVNRGGWVSGNNLAFGVTGTITGTGYGYIGDLASGGETAAVLTIDWTAGGPPGILMPNRFADRVKETATTTGTGDFTLAGAVAQFETFTANFAVGEPFFYAIVGQTGTEWEVGMGSLSSSTVLVRNRILQSSNADAAVSFSAGTKDVYVTISSYYQNRTRTRGQVTAAVSGWNLN